MVNSSPSYALLSQVSSFLQKSSFSVGAYAINRNLRSPANSIQNRLDDCNPRGVFHVMRPMKIIRMRLAFFVAALLSLIEVEQLQCAEGLRPAMIGGGADSVAAKLHYPPNERDSKSEAVVVFFCEVAANGKAKNVRTYWNKGTIVSATRWRKR